MSRSILPAARGRAGTALFIALAVLLGVLAQQQSLAAPVGLGAKTEITDLQPVQANGLVLAHHKGQGHKKYVYKHGFKKHHHKHGYRKHHYKRGHKKGFFKHGHKKHVFKQGHGRKHGFKKFRHGRRFKKFHHGRGFKKFGFGKFRARKF